MISGVGRDKLNPDFFAVYLKICPSKIIIKNNLDSIREINFNSWSIIGK